MKCIWCGAPTEGEKAFYCCWEHKHYHRLFSAEWEYDFSTKKYPDFADSDFVSPKKECKETYSGSGMVDSYSCSCGWKSQPYFDGAEFALEEWKKHKKEKGDG